MFYSVFFTVLVLISLNKVSIYESKSVDPTIDGKNILLIYADDLGFLFN